MKTARFSIIFYKCFNKQKTHNIIENSAYINASVVYAQTLICVNIGKSELASRNINRRCFMSRRDGKLYGGGVE